MSNQLNLKVTSGSSEMAETTSSKTEWIEVEQGDSSSETPAEIPKSGASNEQVETEQTRNEETTGRLIIIAKRRINRGINPLLMEEILFRLVKYLDLESSKNSRLACKLWNEEIKKIFFKNRVIQVPKKFHAQFKPEEEEQKMAELDQLKGFFSSLGFGKIQALKFTDHRDTQSFIRLGLPWEQIETIISTIGQVDMETEGNGQAFDELLKAALSVKQIKLPSPVVGSVENGCTKLLGSILAAANTREMDRKFTHPIVVSDLNLIVKAGKELDTFFELSHSSKIQLEGMSVTPIFNVTTNPGIRVAIAQMLERILERSKNTMVRLYILDYVGGIKPELFRIPVMPQLNIFDLRCSPEMAQQQFGFSPDFQFHTNMPNLQIVHLELGEGTNAQIGTFWNNVFSNIQPVTSVKTLYVQSELISDLIPHKIFETFPAIQFLKLNPTALVDFAHVGQCCSELTALLYDLPKDLGETKLLLSRISGFPLNIIEKILNHFESPENMDRFRRNFSLLDLPALTGLLLVGSTEKYQSFKKYFVLLKYLIFNRLPNVRVDHLPQ